MLNVEWLIITAAIKEVKGRVQGAEGPRNCCHNYCGNNICQSCHSGANRCPAPFCHSVHAKHDTESSVIFLDTGLRRHDGVVPVFTGVTRQNDEKG